MDLSFRVVGGIKDDPPFSENNTATVLCMYISGSRVNDNRGRSSTLTTWSEYSSPSIWPPARVTFSLILPKPLPSTLPFDNDERSLIGAKTLRRDPYVVLRNLI